MSDAPPPDSPEQPSAPEQPAAPEQPSAAEPTAPAPPAAPTEQTPEQPPPVAAPVPPAPPSYGYPYGTPQPMPQTSSDAVVALVLAIVSWAICPVIPAIVSLIFASRAGREIAASNGWVTGEGLVLASKIVSWINIVVWGLVAVFFVIVTILGVMSANVPVDSPNDFNNAMSLLTG